jgi:hypothetical protein
MKGSSTRTCIPKIMHRGACGSFSTSSAVSNLRKDLHGSDVFQNLFNVNLYKDTVRCRPILHELNWGHKFYPEQGQSLDHTNNK